MPQFDKLNDDVDCDVLVIGGGITGLSTAYLLKQTGQRVCLLERDRLAHGDTGCTTAHLAFVTDIRLPSLQRTFGSDRARLAWQGGEAAINTIEQIVDQEEIDCCFHRIPGFLQASLELNRDETQELQEECNLAQELGFAASFQATSPFSGQPAIRYANQAKFDPLRYLAALAKAIPGDGSAIYEESAATDFSADPLEAKANGHRINCHHLVIASHVPLMGQIGFFNATLLQSKLAAYSTYAIGTKVPAARYDEASYWDTSNPYYYLRIDHHADYDYAIFGGKDHRTGAASDNRERFDALAEILHKFIPEARVDRQWSGQVIETNDGLPYIGQTAERQFVATGFGGNGMTFGTLAAMLACDWVLGAKNLWQDLLSVDRKPVTHAVDYVQENLSYPYHIVADRFQRSEARSTREVKRGEGKLLRRDGQVIACSRDETGKLSQVSAVCTHMGCLVHWNNAEHTWDCPCHGSRFQPSGDVLAGPAEEPLAQIKNQREAAVK
jgi:glycine/D-amino acid oxidase-like deaminating enzyme/nitrite reductase/ring-hydroxylating ferredoxin subunit